MPAVPTSGQLSAEFRFRAWHSMTGASAEHDSDSKLPTRFLAILATAALAASACLGNGTSKGIIKIGSDFPTCTAGGQATENGVRFALQQIQSAGGIRGFTLQYEGFDDCRQGEFSPDAGTANVRRMLADAAFLGMVGPYNSDVALDEIPVAAPQHFTMVSPSNTNPCLTKNLVICPVHPQKLRGDNRRQPESVNGRLRVPEDEPEEGGRARRQHRPGCQSRERLRGRVHEAGGNHHARQLQEGQHPRLDADLDRVQGV